MRINLKWDGSEFRVAAYARFSEKPVADYILKGYPLRKEDGIFVLYSGPDPVGFYERIEAPKWHVDIIKKQFEAYVPKEGVVSATGMFVSEDCEDAILSGLEDIIQCDDVRTPSEAIESVNSALAVFSYFHRALSSLAQDSLEDNLKSIESLYSDGEVSDEDLFGDTASRYDEVKGDLSDYLASNYFWPMLCAYQDGDKEGLDWIKNSLKEFIQGAPFSGDVVALCDNIQVGSPLNKGLVIAYIDKIDAIYKQDYERAAELRDKIRNLEGE
ncbi:hypothetical protein D6825_01665 [Candidatus Woesearchaeota archaeon]|nr:MAG: hypothetical protein D6825_01665 [Candidatus Woesearchaeota archaeon]